MAPVGLPIIAPRRIRKEHSDRRGILWFQSTAPRDATTLPSHIVVNGVYLPCQLHAGEVCEVAP